MLQENLVAIIKIRRGLNEPDIEFIINLMETKNTFVNNSELCKIIMDNILNTIDGNYYNLINLNISFDEKIKKFVLNTNSPTEFYFIETKNQYTNILTKIFKFKSNEWNTSYLSENDITSPQTIGLNGNLSLNSSDDNSSTKIYYGGKSLEIREKSYK